MIVYDYKPNSKNKESNHYNYIDNYPKSVVAHGSGSNGSTLGFFLFIRLLGGIEKIIIQDTTMATQSTTGEIESTKEVDFRFAGYQKAIEKSRAKFIQEGQLIGGQPSLHASVAIREDDQKQFIAVGCIDSDGQILSIIEFSGKESLNQLEVFGEHLITLARNAKKTVPKGTTQ